MRALFARLAESEGRFTVSLAHGESRAGHGGVAVAWTVVVRDDARLPLPSSDVRALYRLTGAADLARLGVGGQPDGLCGLEEDGGYEPVSTLTWREVLRALDQLDARASGRAVERIVGTPAREPRYCLTVRMANGASRLVPSCDAVDRLCLEESLLGGAQMRAGGGALAEGRPIPYLDGRRPDPITAWALRPARRPLPCTPGSLALDSAAGNACLWVDLCAPAADDLRAVARALCLPYDAALATLSPEGVGAALWGDDYMALRVPVTRRAPGDLVLAEPLDLIIGRGALVTVHARPLPAIERARAEAAFSRIATASALAELILAEALSSEEALARWVAREADDGAAYAPSASDPWACVPGVLRCKQSAAVLRRAAERRRGALAVAAFPGRDAPASPLPATDYLLAREARLVTSLRMTEGTADGAMRLLVIRAAWRERARRAALIRLTSAFGATAIVGLARLALSSTHLAGLALGATTLVCFLIAGAGGAIAARAGDASGSRAERQARAAWAAWQDEEEIG
jgi:hypothetical protein